MNRLRGGGTYFGHMYTRILGYAEYSIYLNNTDKDDYYHKDYNIAKQKALYIGLLKQLINDEISTDYEITETDKTKRKKELIKIADEIGYLITEYFYLERAQEFQFSHY